MLRPFLLGPCSLLFGALPGMAQTGPSLHPGLTGRTLALAACSPCHVVARDQPQPPILRHRAPSFEAIARRPRVTAEQLAQFLRTTHSTESGPLHMPNPLLDESEIDLVVGYILSQRPPTPGR